MKSENRGPVRAPRRHDRRLGYRHDAVSLSGQPDVDFALDVLPVVRLAETFDESFERGRIRAREFEPGEEVKGLAEVAAMVEPAGDSREIFEANHDVM